MKEYVLCYGKRVDDRDADLVLLVDKVPPPPREDGFNFAEGAARQLREELGFASQTTWLNLPGDEVQPGESMDQTAVRALKEETGLNAVSCEPTGAIVGVGWTIRVVQCLYSGIPDWSIPNGKRLVMHSVGQTLEYGSNILPELRVIIPLCIAEKRWQMMVGTDAVNFDYTLQVRE